MPCVWIYILLWLGSVLLLYFYDFISIAWWIIHIDGVCKWINKGLLIAHSEPVLVSEKVELVDHWGFVDLHLIPLLFSLIISSMFPKYNK